MCKCGKNIVMPHLAWKIQISFDWAQDIWTWACADSDCFNSLVVRASMGRCCCYTHCKTGAVIMLQEVSKKIFLRVLPYFSPVKAFTFSTTDDRATGSSYVNIRPEPHPSCPKSRNSMSKIEILYLLYRDKTEHTFRWSLIWYNRFARTFTQSTS